MMKSRRAPGAYHLFVKATRNDMQQRFPNLSFGDVSRKVAEAWKALEDKSEWTKAAADAQAEFDRNNADSNDASGGPSGAAIKRAPSAYNLFVKAKLQEMKQRYPNLGFEDLSRKVAEEWKSLQDKSEWKKAAAYDCTQAEIDDTLDSNAAKRSSFYGNTLNSEDVPVELPKVLHVKISLTPTPTVISADVQPPKDKKEEAINTETTFMHADLRLETEDGVFIPVHKYVISARSPVLRARIEKEAAEGTLRVGFSAKTMWAVVHWIYKGEVVDHDWDWEELMDVMDAAVLLEIDDLVQELN